MDFAKMAFLLPDTCGNFNKGQMYLCEAKAHRKEAVFIDEEELLFLAGEHGNTFDADVDNQPVQDLALNEDNTSCQI
ncbi:hypothetical protein Tco_0668879 [Tanacetum coccineum]